MTCQNEAPIWLPCNGISKGEKGFEIYHTHWPVWRWTCRVKGLSAIVIFENASCPESTGHAANIDGVFALILSPRLIDVDGHHGGVDQGGPKRGEDAFGIGVGTHNFTHCRG